MNETPSLPDLLAARLTAIDHRAASTEKKVDHLVTITGTLTNQLTAHLTENARVLRQIGDHLTRNRTSIAHVETRTEWAIQAIRAGAVPAGIGGISGLLSVVILHLLGISL
jgi:hypothetical protein